MHSIRIPITPITHNILHGSSLRVRTIQEARRLDLTRIAWSARPSNRDTIESETSEFHVQTNPIMLAVISSVKIAMSSYSVCYFTTIMCGRWSLVIN